MCTRINQTEFYKLLKKRKTSTSEKLCGLIIAMEDPVQDILNYIKTIFPSYTDHSFSHSIRILEATYKILSSNFLKDLSTIEIFCFICATMFHDCGMAIPNHEDIQKQRIEHHRLVKEILEKFFEENLLLLSAHKRICKCVLFACESHNLDIAEFYGHKNFMMEETIENSQVRYNIVAALLRVGDLLDMAEDRVCENTLHALPMYFYENNSFPHHVRHLKIEKFILTSKKINIVVTADSKDEYYIWSQWFEYLEKDIEKANTYLLDNNKSTLHLPPFSYKINHNLEIENLKFELDTEGQLLDIITNSIYTNEFDFIRELIQNAIDSELKDIYLSNDSKISNSSPRSWNPYIQEKKVLVLYSSKQSRLIISDCGVGMNSNDIKKCLFQIANSGTASTNMTRIFPFYSIAKFGIGFISCITRANKITIYSKKDNNPMQIVTLYSGSIYAFFEEDNNYKSNSRDNHGTTIDLILKNSYTSESIRQYLNDTFKYTSISIKYIDMDVMKNFSSNYSNNNIAKRILQRKCLLYSDIEDCYKQLKTKKQMLIENQKNRISPFENILMNCMLQYNILEKSYHRNEYLSQNIFIDIIENIIHQLETINLNEDIKTLLDTLSDIKYMNKEEYRRQYSFFIDITYNSIQNIEKMIEVIRREFTVFPTLSYNIYNNLSPQNNIILAQLDKDFEIKKIYLNDLPDITDNVYLLLIQTSIFDYDKGVELVAWNGFLINNHEIINRIVHINNTESIFNDYNGENFKNINIHTNYNLVDELSFFDNYYEEQENYFSHLDKTIYEVNHNDILFYVSDSKIKESLLKCQLLYLQVDEDKFESSIIDLFDSMYHMKSNIYQDGIKLDVDISSLFPFGFCRCIANLTATSRFLLNITRHNISDNSEVIGQWMTKTGVSIQKRVLENISNTLKKLKCSADKCEIICPSSNKSIFSKLSLLEAKINFSIDKC